MGSMLRVFIVVLTALLVCQVAVAEPLMVGAAANFAAPLEKLAALFTEESGIRVEKSISSTGKLFAQIKNGAPFDLFLAADTDRPELLFQEGICEEPLVYARGRVVLWSGLPELRGATNWRDAVSRHGITRLAIAKPDIAPYGDAARQALLAAGLWEEVESRLVYAQNVAQAFQYAETHAAQAAFIAMSFALSDQGRKGSHVEIPEAPVVIQKACVVRNAAEKEAAVHFLTFLQSDQARQLLALYGYR